MSTSSLAYLRAATVAIAPTVVLAAWLYHPFIATPTDASDVAAEATADLTRWGLAHIILGAGYGLMILAFVALRSGLREAGEERWSGFALPFIVLGSLLFAMLTGMEFVPLAAAESGGDPEAAQTELRPWFVTILVISGVSFALGAIGFALAIARSKILNPPLSRVVVVALLVLAFGRFVPLGAAQIVLGLAGVAALWPIAYHMWTEARKLEAASLDPLLAP